MCLLNSCPSLGWAKIRSELVWAHHLLQPDAFNVIWAVQTDRQRKTSIRTVYCRVQWHIGKSSSGHVTSISTESHDKRRSSSSDSRIWYAHFTVTLLGPHRPRALWSPQRSPQFYIHHSHRGGLVFSNQPGESKTKVDMSTTMMRKQTVIASRCPPFTHIARMTKNKKQNPECSITIKGNNLHGTIHMYTVSKTLHFESNKRSVL